MPQCSAILCQQITTLKNTSVTVATRRRTLGDRAFPDAWNSLPSFVRDQQSLAAFRQQLKTVLFRISCGEDAII